MTRALADSDKRRRRRQVAFRVLLVAVFVVVTMAPPLLWPSVTYAQTVTAAAAIVGAIVAIQKADASADAAARAEAAQETALRASRAAHYALAFHARPNVGVDWYRPAEGFTRWDLHLTADRPAKDVKAEWFFANGSPSVRASFPDITPDPKDSFNRSTPRQVIPLGLPPSVKPAEMYRYIVKGTVEYTDVVGLARWRRTWRYQPPSADDPEWAYLNAPKSTQEWELVELLQLPSDL